MERETYPKSGIPIRRTVDLLPQTFKTEANTKFFAGTMDPLVQPGSLEKIVGYYGRRFGRTFSSKDVYLDTDQTLRSRYQLEPGVVVRNDLQKIENFYDYIDFKNQLKFFNNNLERDDLITDQDHYSWDPPIDWDKFANFREYYWIPDGPPPIVITGQRQSITSTYRVRLGVTSTWIFFPDGLTNNPTITLYRGQTYKFQINAPNEGFVIRTNYDTGSLLYKPYLPYSKGQLAVYDGKLWRAKTDIPITDQSTIDQFSEDWEYLEVSSQATSLDYNKGVTNNGIQNGTLTFKVPLDAPDVLFYQSAGDINRFGRFLIGDVEDNTKIDVEKEIIGKATYTSSNGIAFSNGMKVRFEGQVLPEKYAKDTWIVEGVGESIQLIRFQDLIPPVLSTNSLEILFDNGGFDTEPFDDATTYPESKDYVTINRSSRDGNPWSRYNRWFHKSVLELAHKLSNSDFDAPETSRAKRPIIEFQSHLKLFNHGAVAKQPVDFVDTFTTDVFSTIEGSLGYNVDGEELFNGARLLVVADTDSLANNKIYTVNFIRHNNRRQINLIPADDAQSVIGEGVFVRRGNANRGTMFHFDGTNWVASQKKTVTNQSPLFDVFDENEISFGDLSTYPVSTFIGSKIVSYKVGNSVADNELGFSLSYLNIDNVGDIQFNFDWDTETFEYQVNKQILNKSIRTGFYQFTDDSTYGNNWIKIDRNYLQPIIDSTLISEDTFSFENNSIRWDTVQEDKIFKVLIYVNGNKYRGTYTRDRNAFTIDTKLIKGDIVVLKVYTSEEPYLGYYEIPLGLEKNPLNQEISSFTLGQAVDHVSTALDLYEDFDGDYPGTSNLRDITGYQNLGKRFLKHSGITPTVISLLCDKNINVVKSLQFAKKSYNDFKNNFIRIAETLDFDGNVVDFVDNILEELNKVKTGKDPFADSDMVGTGAFTSRDYIVEDTGIKTFALSEVFQLDSLSRKAVYLYINNVQLLHKYDYNFNPTFGFVELTDQVTLNEGDRIQIREYLSTSSCFIPATPTKLGLYKKWVPRKFRDTSYIDPVDVIQGHDGSITVTYEDFRDDVLLELEKRIFNNIKQQYDETVFDLDNIVGSYYYEPFYKKSELDEVIFYDFLKWIQDTNIDYLSNPYFDSENSFTYTYSQMADPTGLINLPGWWRGVYRWFYDTDRPQDCPWEMLGFTEKPNWWENEYGPAPYTRNNLILWEDLANGIIKQGPRAGVYPRYKRSTLLEHIPTDADGNLLSPFDSGLARNFVLINNKGEFKFGDVNPVESAWRTSSEYPFSVITAMCVLRPYEFIIESLDRSRIKINKIGQTVHANTGLFTKNEDIVYPVVGGDQTSGLINYIVDYVKKTGFDYKLVKDKIDHIDVNLSVRMSGFVDQPQQKFLLDSKNPRSTTSSIFIPPENYDIVFNVSSPILSPSYSGMIVEKVSTGWKVYGYDFYAPYFTVYEPLRSESDPLISVGGISENFVDWKPNLAVTNGTIVRYNELYYRALKSHTSSNSFDVTLWQRLPKLPLVGAVEVFRRRNWQFATKRIAYGTIYKTLQEVADAMLGYEEYLIRQGFVFNDYDPTLETPKNWTTSVKEFLFWTTHKWALGSIITLSPLASRIKINLQVGVVDSLLDSFYDYNILKDNGNILTSEFINVTRGFREIVVDTANTDDGIYFFKCYLVLKEHVTIFTDRTVFNDVMYDKPTGYRQDRVKCRGFRTVDWDGDYTSPGFLFDEVDIQVWQPFTDYKLGDIVSYKSYNWVSLKNQPGVESFDDTNWSKLDTVPTKGLVKNFDYNVNLFEDFYSVDADGAGASQRDLARHLIGYQTRDYLQNLAEDAVTQFKLYQGFIREKGTLNSVVKVFDKLSRVSADSIVLNEEWAIQTGKLGGVDQTQEVEFNIYKKDLLVNPQPILITAGPKPTDNLDKYLRVNQTDFNRSYLPYTTNINPVIKYTDITRDAGYVRKDQIEITVKDEDELLTLDISNIVENSHIWLTFDKNSWNVYRFNLSKSLIILGIQDNPSTQILTITYNQPLQIQSNEIIGILGLDKLDGFHRVLSVEGVSLTIAQPAVYAAPELPDTSSLQYNTYLLTPARFNNYQDIDQQSASLLKAGARIFVDNKEENSEDWEVIEKVKLYNSESIREYGSTDPRNVGRDVEYIPSLNAVVSGIPNSNVAVMYKESGSGLAVQQLIFPESGYENYLNKSFGDCIASSPDGQWLAIGAPLASGVPNRFKGYFSSSAVYMAGDLVLFNGQLWESLNEQNTIGFDPQDDGSTDTLLATSSKFRDLDWKLATIVNANLTGAQGPTNQGAVFLYKFTNNLWNLEEILLSPRIAANEKFGHKISIGVSGNNYYMSVSAPGSLDNLGRVYLYKFVGSGSRTTQQVLTISGSVAVNFSTNVITFNRNHNYLTGQVLRYINGTYGGEDKSTATSPPPPEDYTLLYAIRVDATRIQLALSIEDAASGSAIDLRDFGIDDSSSHTFINQFITGWQHLENVNYRGIYDTTGTSLYAINSVVWYNGRLYKALEETLGNTTSLDLNLSWQLLDNAATQNSLPSNISLEDTPTDGSSTDSTMEVGSVYPVVSASEIKAGEIYTIENFGSTDFTSIGYNPAANNLTFKATAAGIGTGTVRWNSYQFAELVNAGDMFGAAMSMNRDGSILVIGAPESNGQYFNNFRGVWTSYQEYFEDDIVKYNGSYYQLRDTVLDSALDSTLILTSKNQVPTSGDPWYYVDSSDNVSSGKVFVYKRSVDDVYELKQSISNDSLDLISDVSANEDIKSGDNFGTSVDIDYTGTTIIASSPKADNKFTDQGAVYVFKTTDVTTANYRLKQKLISHESYANEFFGSDISISSATERIVVGARNATFKLPVLFDQNTTTFDNTNTRYFNEEGNTGQAYVFDRKDQTYFLTEKLEADNFQDWESFGTSVDCYGSVIAVGSPAFRNNFYRKLNGVIPTGGSGIDLVVNLTLLNGSVVSIEIDDQGNGYSVSDFNNDLDVLTLPGSTSGDNAQFKIVSVSGTGGVLTTFITYNGSNYSSPAETLETGNVRIFRKDPTKTSWNSISTRSDLVDIKMFNGISIYDDVNKVKLLDAEIVDHYKLKILGEADQEIKFKTMYDPAVYTTGTDNQEVDENQAWFEKYVGQLWWDISKVKFLNYEQGDTDYRVGNWNQQAYGSSIDIYEWVETKYTPARWAQLADTNEGLSLGISGQPLYADNSVYSQRTLTNPNTGEDTETKYYYWVKNSTIIPKNVIGRRLSAAVVSTYIDNPISTGIQFISPIASDKFLAFNFDSLISTDYALVNIQYKNDNSMLNPVHSEYQLITEGVADSLPNDALENKWIDSLVGYDRSGKTVPDDTIPVKQRYGLAVRPRQSMFADRFSILRRTLENINTVLLTRAFADTINYNNLNLVENIPNEILNEYDQAVDTLVDLQQVGTTRVRKAILQANIVDGQIDTIDIIDSGFGYKNTPFVTIEGDGIGALATITTDSQGKVNSVTVTSKGRNYTTAIVQIRYFSVLVRNDESIKNYWSIYAWDDQRRTFFRSKSQAYDTTKYWIYADYWAQGYSPTSRIVKEILDIYQEPTLSVNIGDLIRVKEFANGGWAVLEKTETGSGNLLNNYNLVGRNNGTIQLLISELAPDPGVGYDRRSSFDADLYDINPTRELRNILKAVKEDIFIEDLSVEWNKLFFTGLRYVFVEQKYVDWAFKTSFVNATHNVGDLEQKVSYKNDNLDSFFEYIEEVKPYKTSIREYVSKYTEIDRTGSAVTDFDLPPYYSVTDNKILPINFDSSLLNTYPYKWWTDNNGYSVVEISVSYGGTDYTDPPTVIIEGNGAGATAQAYISNGSVTAIKVLTEGFGYTKTPTVLLVGGNGTSQNKAKAAVVLGKTPVRNLNLTVKFDRIAKQGYFQDYTVSETFTATGLTAVFNLRYAPNRDKSKISIFKNGDIILDSDYTLSLYYNEINGYNLLSGKLTFKATPSNGDVITVSYEKNIELFESLNRIDRHYAPLTGMKGKEPAQLMTGIDFGGVQIQGTTFDVTGGWDALPWFTDSWDSVESNSDYYYIADGSTISVTLPFTPAVGEQISIYWKPAGNRIPSNIDTLGPATAPQVIQNPESAEPRTIRVDDPNWVENWDSSNTTNPNAQMPTFVGDGSTRVVEIGQYISVQAGDTLIFRKLDSDGSVTITDVNLLDTLMSGGSLSNIAGAYVTATGSTPEEIIIDGDKFISPDQVPAPEENIPGQVLESVSIKVYQTTKSGAAPLQNRVIYADGASRRFSIGLEITEDKSVLVYLNKVKQEKIQVDSSLDYDIDYVNNEIVFTNVPPLGAIVEIIAFGLGGIALLDYQEFVADGETRLFLTKAVYSQTESVLVTVDGIAIDTGFSNSSEFTDTQNRVIVQFGFAPADGAVVKVVSLGAALDTDSSQQSVVRVNQQVFYYDGSSTSFELDRFVNLSRASAESNLLVTLNGLQLKGPENTIVIYDGTNNEIAVGTDPLRFPGSITYLTIKVYLNNILATAVVDWTLNSTTNVITVRPDLLEENDVIRVVIDAFADYTLQGDTLTLTSSILDTMNNNDDSTAKDILEVTWFSEYPSMDLVTDQYAGGKVNYKLSRIPVNERYVWVYLNGTRLTLNQDYKVSLQRGVVYLNVSSTLSDELKIVEFGNDIYKFPSAYEIYKDMLNRYQFKRYSRNEIKLTSALNYYDTTITVNDGSGLYDPTGRSAPGVVYINNEKIEYLQKNGNVLSQLRRGSLGTAIAEIHAIDSYVSDSGPAEIIPYNETQHRLDFVSDGSTLLVGPLDFVPTQGARSAWFKETIPAEYGACDQAEVFVAGTRLRKNPIDVWDEEIGAYSPAGDKQVEAEFSVDGVSPYIRLTKAVAAGTRITVIRRTGKTWYDRGATTATTGKTMNENSTAITRFILQKTTIIPE
jgi:hypothetical protein